MNVSSSSSSIASLDSLNVLTHGQEKHPSVSNLDANKTNSIFQSTLSSNSTTSNNELVNDNSFFDEIMWGKDNQDWDKSNNIEDDKINGFSFSSSSSSSSTSNTNALLEFDPFLFENLSSNNDTSLGDNLGLIDQMITSSSSLTTASLVSSSFPNFNMPDGNDLYWSNDDMARLRDKIQEEEDKSSAFSNSCSSSSVEFSPIPVFENPSSKKNTTNFSSQVSDSFSFPTFGSSSSVYGSSSSSSGSQTNAVIQRKRKIDEISKKSTSKSGNTAPTKRPRFNPLSSTSALQELGKIFAKRDVKGFTKLRKSLWQTCKDLSASFLVQDETLAIGHLLKLKSRDILTIIEKLSSDPKNDDQKKALLGILRNPQLQGLSAESWFKDFKFIFYGFSKAEQIERINYLGLSGVLKASVSNPDRMTFFFKTIVPAFSDYTLTVFVDKILQDIYSNPSLESSFIQTIISCTWQEPAQLIANFLKRISVEKLSLLIGSPSFKCSNVCKDIILDYIYENVNNLDYLYSSFEALQSIFNIINNHSCKDRYRLIDELPELSRFTLLARIGHLSCLNPQAKRFPGSLLEKQQKDWTFQNAKKSLQHIPNINTLLAKSKCILPGTWADIHDSLLAYIKGSNNAQSLGNLLVSLYRDNSKKNYIDTLFIEPGHWKLVAAYLEELTPQHYGK